MNAIKVIDLAKSVFQVCVWMNWTDPTPVDDPAL